MSVQDLDQRFPIVDGEGKATDYLLRLLRDRGSAQTDTETTVETLSTDVDTLTDEVALKADKATTITAGTGLSGGGDLSADRTISLDASIDDLTDVDTTSTPPTDGQALVWDNANSLWVPGDVAAGGGGGGASWETPVLVQSVATLRNDGTIALGSSPTVGNLMVLVTAGFGGTLDSYAPSGFTRVERYTSNSNNAVECWVRTVQSGDTGSYSLSASDNQSAVLYEFSHAATVMAISGGGMSSFFSGNDFTLPVLPSPFANTIRLIAFEHDTTPVWSITTETGLTPDYAVSADGNNHTGAFARVTDSFDGEMAGSLSGSPDNPVFGVFAVVGTPSSGGGGGGGGTPTIRAGTCTSFAASSVAVSWPTGTVAGDVVIIFACHGYGATDPAGWTVLDNQTGSNINGAIWGKVMTSADITAGSVTISFAGSYDGTVAAVTLDGATTTFYASAAATRSSSGATSASETISSVASTDQILAFAATRANTTCTITNASATTLQSSTGTNMSGTVANITGDSGVFGLTITETFGSAGLGYYVGAVAFR